MTTGRVRPAHGHEPDRGHTNKSGLSRSPVSEAPASRSPCLVPEIGAGRPIPASDLRLRPRGLLRVGGSRLKRALNVLPKKPDAQLPKGKRDHLGLRLAELSAQTRKGICGIAINANAGCYIRHTLIVPCPAVLIGVHRRNRGHNVFFFSPRNLYGSKKPPFGG